MPTAGLPAETVFLLSVVALCAATISGVIGMAGGILLLTAMVLVGIPPHVAVPAHALVQLASNGSRFLALRQHVRWRPLITFALASLPFPILGLLVVGALEPSTWKAGMGVMALAAALRPSSGPNRLREGAAMVTVGALAGTLGVVVGATGPLIAPFFLRQGWSKEEIVAVKATSQTWTHLQKTAAFVWLAPGLAAGGLLEEGDLPAFDPLSHLGLLLPLAVAVVAGTLVGTRLLRRYSEARWRLAFRTVLGLTGARLLLDPVLEALLG
jgi:uncharacterized membrane protein YfcA